MTPVRKSTAPAGLAPTTSSAVADVDYSNFLSAWKAPAEKLPQTAYAAAMQTLTAAAAAAQSGGDDNVSGGSIPKQTAGRPLMRGANASPLTTDSAKVELALLI